MKRCSIWSWWAEIWGIKWRKGDFQRSRTKYTLKNKQPHGFGRRQQLSLVIG